MNNDDCENESGRKINRSTNNENKSEESGRKNKP
jgi:hypothetical protein